MRSRYNQEQLINKTYYKLNRNLHSMQIQIDSVNFKQIITMSTDRLDLLAKKYFGYSNLWWIIALVNRDILSGNSLYVQPGIILYIPNNYLQYL